MKKIVTGLMAILLAACAQNKMKDGDLSGSYARRFESEFAIGTDTLQLEKVSVDTYQITKSSAYQRIMDGKLMDNMERHTEHWLGVYDPDHHLLDIRPSGKVLSVNQDKGQLLLGSSVYQRLNKNK